MSRIVICHSNKKYPSFRLDMNESKQIKTNQIMDGWISLENCGWRRSPHVDWTWSLLPKSTSWKEWNKRRRKEQWKHGEFYELWRIMDGLPGPTELHGLAARWGGGGREKGIGHWEPHILAGDDDNKEMTMTRWQWQDCDGKMMMTMTMMMSMMMTRQDEKSHFLKRFLLIKASNAIGTD